MTCTCEDRGVIIVMHKSAAGTDHCGLNYIKNCANKDILMFAIKILSTIIFVMKKLKCCFG